MAVDLLERRAVAKVRTPGLEGTTKAGSGVLVNNGLGTPGAPFLVTAAHLFDTNGDGEIEGGEGHSAALQAEFFFGLDANCNGEAVAEPYVVQGAIFLSADGESDLALLQLNVFPNEIIANANPYFVGWDFAELFPQHVDMIHHPCCDTRMVSGGEFPYDDNGFIRLNGLACGGAQPGSSGAPLFSTAAGNLIGIQSGVLGPGDGAPVVAEGELCAGENGGVIFGRFNDFGFQHLGALDSLPPYDPMAP